MRTTEGDRTRYRCKTCGEFEITGSSLQVIESGTFPKEQQYRLSARTHRSSMAGVLLIITGNTIEDVTNTPLTDQAPLDVLDELMLVIHQRSWRSALTEGDNRPIGSGLQQRGATFSCNVRRNVEGVIWG